MAAGTAAARSSWRTGGVVGNGLPPESVPGRSVARCTGAGTSELSVSDAAGHWTAATGGAGASGTGGAAGGGTAGAGGPVGDTAGAAGAAGGTVIAIVGRSSGRAGTADRS
ncbi:hypothetical protein SMICM304S_07330 [Streptomyces microflavus]